MSSAEPRYVDLGLVGSIRVSGCEDCGAMLFSRTAHTRFHSILNGHAWALAVLKTSHIAAHTHDRYDVPERIDSKQFDSYEALAEVLASLPDADPSGDEG